MFARLASIVLFSSGFVVAPFHAALAQVGSPLGTAQSFAVLGGSAVTNTGPTIVTGDLGVSPGTAVSGFFSPGIVIGTIHAADAVALQAQNDSATAYTDLAGQVCDVDLTGQDLGGTAPVSGVYCFTSSVGLTGTLTLDAAGDPDAVWVFQIGSTLTTASHSSVLLTHGAQACNVFWQVGSSATFGTDTTFVGNILALASITLTTNATVSGRALAQNGAVTMDSNVVTISGCAVPPVPTVTATVNTTTTPTAPPTAITTLTATPTVTAQPGTPTATRTATPTATRTATVTATPTLTVTPTLATQTATPAVTATGVATSTPTPTLNATPTVTVLDVGTPTLPGPTPTPGPLDHFHCYETERPPARIFNVSLVDEFGPSIVHLKRAKRFCAPADKNDEDPTAPLDPDQLMVYTIKQDSPGFSRRRVSVTNQFGTIVLDLIRPDALLVPSAGSLMGPIASYTPAIDHFKCYRTRGRFRSGDLSIDDQFGSIVGAIKRPVRFCAPVNKNGEGILDGSTHLLCYQVRSAAGAPTRDMLYSLNQFGADRFRVFGSRELCVPSTLN